LCSQQISYTRNAHNFRISGIFGDFQDFHGIFKILWDFQDFVGFSRFCGIFKILMGFPRFSLDFDEISEDLIGFYGIFVGFFGSLRFSRPKNPLLSFRKKWI